MTDSEVLDAIKGMCSLISEQATELSEFLDDEDCALDQYYEKSNGMVVETILTRLMDASLKIGYATRFLDPAGVMADYWTKDGPNIPFGQDYIADGSGRFEAASDMLRRGVK